MDTLEQNFCIHLQDKDVIQHASDHLVVQLTPVLWALCKYSTLCNAPD